MSSQHSFPSNSRGPPYQPAPSSNANMAAAGQTHQATNQDSPFLGSDGIRLYPNMLFCPGITKYPLIRFIPAFVKEQLHMLAGTKMIPLQGGGTVALNHNLHCGHCHQNWTYHPGVDHRAHRAVRFLTCKLPCAYCKEIHPEKLCPRVYVSRKKLGDVYPWPANVHPPAHIRLHPTAEETLHLKAAGYLADEIDGLPQFTQASFDIIPQEEALFQTTIFANHNYEADRLRESAARASGYQNPPQRHRPVQHGDRRRPSYQAGSTVERNATPNPMLGPASRPGPPMYRFGSQNRSNQQQYPPSANNDEFAQPQRSEPPPFDLRPPPSYQNVCYFGTAPEGVRERQPHGAQPRPGFDDQMSPPSRAPLPTHGYYMPADYEPRRLSRSPERRIKSEMSPPPTPRTAPSGMSDPSHIGYISRRGGTEQHRVFQANEPFNNSNAVDYGNTNASNTKKRKILPQKCGDVDSMSSSTQSQPFPGEEDSRRKKPKYVSQKWSELEEAKNEVATITGSQNATDHDQEEISHPETQANTTDPATIVRGSTDNATGQNQQDIHQPDIHQPEARADAHIDQSTQGQQVMASSKKSGQDHVARELEFRLRLPTKPVQFKTFDDLPADVSVSLRTIIHDFCRENDSRQRQHARYLKPELETQFLNEDKCMLSYVVSKNKRIAGFKFGKEYSCDTCHYALKRPCVRLQKLDGQVMLVVYPKGNRDGFTWQELAFWA